MNEIATSNIMLPETLPDLSKFVLVGREKLNAVRAEIRAINKVGLAREVRDQKLREAQDIADAVLDAEVRIGELTASIPKAQGIRNDLKPVRTGAEKSKAETLQEIGIKQDTAERLEQLARHPEKVEEAKAKAREEERIVTRQDVLKEIKKPHVVNNSKDDEWYTPARFIESARRAMGSIDLDPASNDFANETIRAGEYYTEADNGLEKEWFGNVWLNPPYSSALIQRFADKVVNSEFNQAIVLVNNATETGWFRKLADNASAIVFTTGRIKYYKRDGEHGTPLQGQAFLYFGNNEESFLNEFLQYGWGCLL